jgi:hypothetical protein
MSSDLSSIMRSAVTGPGLTSEALCKQRKRVPTKQRAHSSERICVVEAGEWPKLASARRLAVCSLSRRQCVAHKAETSHVGDEA